MRRFVLLYLLFISTIKGLNLSSKSTRPNLHHRVDKYIEIRIHDVPLLRFLPLPTQTFHHFVSIAERSKGCGSVILDFIPKDRRSILSLITLLLGKDQPGQIRCITLHDSESLEFINTVNAICRDWHSDINIYNHNCQHFSEFVMKRFSSYNGKVK